MYKVHVLSLVFLHAWPLREELFYLRLPLGGAQGQNSIASLHEHKYLSD